MGRTGLQKPRDTTKFLSVNQIIIRSGSIIVCLLFLAGCNVFNFGKLLWIVPTAGHERYFVLKDSYLTAGSAAHPKDSFNHTMHETVNLVFIPKNERNEYAAESRWFDPTDQEYRTIRTTFDIKKEAREGMERRKDGTPRVHSMPTRELANHKKGLWKVVLYIDNQLARELTFSVM